MHAHKSALKARFIQKPSSAIVPPSAVAYRDREDEWFYVVEGQVSFLINGTWTGMFPGDCVYSPRGSVHAFKNNTDQPIRLFIHVASSGFERFFAEAAEEWARPLRRNTDTTPREAAW